MRVEQIGDATLFNGDCLEVIRSLNTKIDVILTDPPYGIEGIVGSYGRKGLTIANDRDLGVCGNSLREAVAVAPDAWFAVFYSCRVTPGFR